MLFNYLIAIWLITSPYKNYDFPVFILLSLLQCQTGAALGEDIFWMS